MEATDTISCLSALRKSDIRPDGGVSRGQILLSSVTDVAGGSGGSSGGSGNKEGKRRLGLGFRVWGSGFRVWGLGFRVWGLGFRV